LRFENISVQMIRVLVIDDDQLNRVILTGIIREHFPELVVVGEATSVQSSIETIQRLSPDLIFLDIDLGDGNAFDMLVQLPLTNFHIIFVTSLSNYAIEAFKVNALDYLLKPVNPSALRKAIEKVKKEAVSKNYDRVIEDLARLRILNENNGKRIVVSAQRGLKFINPDDFVRCESEGSYTKIVQIDGQNFLSSKNLKEFANELPGNMFFRAHHSHLINMKQVDYFNKQDMVITMFNGDSVPLAQRKKTEFLELLTII
jgi:two-component system, LytTR family, response regulator